MKERITLTNQSIIERCARLQEKAERKFAAIVIPSTISSPALNEQNNGGMPPISYILYGVAGLAALGAIFSKARLLFLGIGAACVYGGYRTSKMKSSINTQSNPTSGGDFNSIKTEVTTKVIEAVKSTAKEWEDFMELKQKEVRLAIESSSYSASQKDAMMSKVYVYEIIDISLSDFTYMIKDVNNTENLKTQVSTYKSKLINAINDAATRQTTKFSSILDVIS